MSLSRALIGQQPAPRAPTSHTINVTKALDSYRTSTIAGLSDSKFDNILKPSKPKKPVTKVTILGFDTEFTNDGRLLTVQLAGQNGGAIVSKVFYTSELDKSKLFEFARQFCQEYSIQ